MILDKKNISAITAYLQSRQLINADETVLHAEKPGEGNMNYVLRITLPQRSLILKQARPYVEKYPSIPAPEERVIIEGEFYKLVQENAALKSSMPAIFEVDKANHILVLEDLGEAKDFTFLYQQSNQLSLKEAKALSKFISVLHNSSKPGGVNELMANRKLRALNHEHIFMYPLMVDNGFDLNSIQQGLQELAMPFKNNEALKQAAKELGAVYLKDGDTLLHGDYYPGSWLKTGNGVKVIDPEFCFYGAREFDLGVMMAHLKMAQQADEITGLVLSSYQKPDGFDDDLFRAFIGMEIIRRIIGLAQLPLTLTLAQKESLLDEALRLLNISKG